MYLGFIYACHQCCVARDVSTLFIFHKAPFVTNTLVFVDKMYFILLNSTLMHFVLKNKNINIYHHITFMGCWS